MMFICNQLLDVSFDLWDGLARVFGAMFNFEVFVVHVQNLHLLYMCEMVDYFVAIVTYIVDFDSVKSDVLRSI